jgi:hypothetical protein
LCFSFCQGWIIFFHSCKFAMLQCLNSLFLYVLAHV